MAVFDVTINVRSDHWLTQKFGWKPVHWVPNQRVKWTFIDLLSNNLKVKIRSDHWNALILLFIGTPCIYEMIYNRWQPSSKPPGGAASSTCYESSKWMKFLQSRNELGVIWWEFPDRKEYFVKNLSDMIFGLIILRVRDEMMRRRLILHELTTCYSRS